MPAPIIENVAEPVVAVRDLEADEEYVMLAFERHADHCAQCVDPLRVHEENGSLCDRGHRYALNVAEYLYSKNGKAYSVVDREVNQPTLVKIPRNCLAVRGLLLAMEDGLRLHRQEQESPAVREPQTPVISYDATYPVPPRRTATQPVAPVAYHEVIEREPRTLKRRRVIIYPAPRDSPRDSPSRGSLYEADAADRVERQKESSRIYRPADYHR
ncbi:hypothetical protein BDW42DRAFT_46710 [Aspergillus taichungensis]|uniref:Uncharacterized protein n=1 Tax=Aspergillus taichungensis TaxID=482145 RepID=A0A2J5HDW9_9EURO|nr:hypothetical protein BDW42DRAFT_46710 [Aspergillus taichungensis]